MKRLTKDEILAELSAPNGSERLMQANVDIDSMFNDAVDLFCEQGAASALLIRYTNKKQYLFKLSQSSRFTDAVTQALKDDSGKLRRNAARLMGALKRDEFVEPLIDALSAETQRFARPSMLLALGSIGGVRAASYLADYKVAPFADETEKKHYLEEQNALAAALRSTAPRVEHTFIGLAEPYSIELRAPDMLAHQLASELDELGISSFDQRRDSLKTTTADYPSLFEARCFSEALFPIASGVPIAPDAISKRSAPFIEKLMRGSHSGSVPFRFRVELKIESEERTGLIRDICAGMESESLVNAPSDYEVELRIEGNMQGARLYAKLYTFEDVRFAYRAESIPASMEPSVAAAMLRFASEHLSVNARVIDPCCGSGTLLIERGMLSPCASLTGVDISHAAIDIARRNTALTELPCKYTVNDILRFECHRPYDELICNLPFGNRVGSHSSCETLYAGLLDKLPKLVKKGGIAVLYTMEFTLLKRFLRDRSSFLTLLGQGRTEAGGLTPMIFIVRVGK